MKTQSLTMGVFTIVDTINTVGTGDNNYSHIDVICKSDTLGTFSEKVKISISECLPQYIHNGHEIEIKAEVMLPTVDLSDLASIFRESYIVEGENDVNLGKEVS